MDKTHIVMEKLLKIKAILETIYDINYLKNEYSYETISLRKVLEELDLAIEELKF